jgi:hypothetical protein
VGTPPPFDRIPYGMLPRAYDRVSCISVYTGERKLVHDGVVVHPYGQFLEAMWEDKLFS